jgi:hypothetical protein
LALIAESLTEHPLIAHTGDVGSIFQGALILQRHMQARRVQPVGAIEGYFEGGHPALLAIGIEPVLGLRNGRQREGRHAGAESSEP